MRAKWMCAAATVALLAGGLGASAQVAGEKQQEPGAATQQQAPSTGAQKSPTAPGGAAQESGTKKPETAQGTTGDDAKQSGATKQPATKSTQSKDDAPAGKAAQQKEDGQKDKSTAQSGAKSKAQDTAQGEKAGKAGQQATGKSKEKQTTTEADPDTPGSKQGTAGAKQAPGSKEDTAGAKQAPGTKQDTAGKGPGDDDVQVSEEERTKIQQSVNVDEARVRDVNFNVTIGSTVPRRVNLHPLPQTIISMNPRWRNYRYVVVENEIVIINPQTYRVVEVIPASGGRQAQATGGARAQVQLNTQQRQRILTYAREECETVLSEPDFEVGVGIRIPEQIELCPFEDVVVRDVDVVRPYRFIVVQDQVVLVDPSTHTIVEVVR